MHSLRPPAERTPYVYRWVCLVVVFSFLYNPFLFAAATSRGPKLSHSASHRATVASSELQQLAPMGGQDSQLDTNLFFLELPFKSAEVTPRATFVETADEVLPQDAFSANLWFRPPPIS
jgi:hypothetical protein